MFQSSIDVAILAQFTYYSTSKPMAESQLKKGSIDTTETSIQTTDMEDSVNLSEAEMNVL